MPGRTCQLPGCGGAYRAKGYCMRHYMQVWQGKPLRLEEPPPPTQCKGCGVPIPPTAYRGNPRVWCSESCRVRTYQYGTGVVPPQKCATCGDTFAASRRDQLYCGPLCRQQASTNRRRERHALPVPLPRPCQRCGTVFTPRANNAAKARYCSQSCGQPEMSQRRRARLAAALVEQVNPLAVYERDRWICQLCDLPIDRTAKPRTHPSPSLDHKLPLARGGAHSMANLQATHWLCNTVKNSREELPWPAVVLLRRRLVLDAGIPIDAIAS